MGGPWWPADHDLHGIVPAGIRSRSKLKGEATYSKFSKLHPVNAVVIKSKRPTFLTGRL